MDARCGQRLRMSVPQGYWKTTTFTGKLRLTGMTASMVLDGPRTREWFLAYVEQVPMPSHPTNAPTTSGMLAIMHTDWKML